MKKKILFVIDNLQGGGAEKVLTDIIKNLDKSKFDITVLSIFNTGKYIDEVKKYSNYKYIFSSSSYLTIFTKVINSIKYRYAKYILRKGNLKPLYKRNIKDKYDVEVSFLEGYASSFVANSNNKSSKKIAWIHTDLLITHWSKNYFKNNSEKENYLKYNEILCVSKDVQKSFIKKFNLINNVGVQYNPLDEKLILQNSIKKINISRNKEKFLMVTLGRLEPQKSYDRLLSVCNKLIKDGLEFELWILGEGTQRKQLEEYIKTNKMESYIKLLGFQSNPYKYLSKADLFVCSSIAEGFSTVATEATILKIPTVTTDCAGMKELFGDSEYGLITENSEISLYKGLKNILEDINLYNFYKHRVSIRSSDFKLSKRIKEIEKRLL